MSPSPPAPGSLAPRVRSVLCRQEKTYSNVWVQKRIMWVCTGQRASSDEGVVSAEGKGCARARRGAQHFEHLPHSDIENFDTLHLFHSLLSGLAGGAEYDTKYNGCLLESILFYLRDGRGNNTLCPPLPLRGLCAVCDHCTCVPAPPITVCQGQADRHTKSPASGHACGWTRQRKY